ncbi:MAG: formate dehydrogenase accessory sulfurtransferase FdhD [Porticoccaceae bacterium]|nr:formate dehydrogenase accessory sulfurtransferase FdhD [Porticoccaceae bacterium]
MKQRNKSDSSKPGSADNTRKLASGENPAAVVGEVSASRQVQDWRAGQSTLVDDQIIEEQAVALVYNGISHVVMMATPDHLEDFALGFSLSEGILLSPNELYDLEVRHQDKGIEVAMTVSTQRFAHLKEARRNMTGRTGCGLCGAESLEQAIREPALISGAQQFSHDAIERAVRSLEANQPLQSVTGAVHGAAWCDGEGNIELVREDVGRHNALDKLYGSLCRDHLSGDQQQLSANHFVLISSRASYEMVVKAAAMGVEMLVAVSAPTRLAIDLAERVNITLVGFARPGRHMVYSHPQRIV